MKTVAVVEDNPDNRFLLTVLLEGLYRVREYEDGPSALDGFRVATPDLVLLDISLPGIDGIEVLRLMRADPHLADLPVIALTAHAAATDRDKFIGAGFNDYVTKPIVDERVLLGAIARLVRTSH